MTRETIRKRFDETYQKLYGRTYPDSPVEFINFRVRRGCRRGLLQLRSWGPGLGGGRGVGVGASKGTRPAYSAQARDFVPYTVYDRYKLGPGSKFAGPAIVEEKESTVVVGEGARCSIDEVGFLWIELGKV